MNDRSHATATSTTSTQRDQRIRMRRFHMAVASYALWYAIALVGVQLELIHTSLAVMLLAGVAIVVTQLIFFVLFRSGANLRFGDPSLTLPQILVGLMWGLVLIAVARDIRGLVLTVYMVTLLFGIFGLEPRRFLIAATAGYVGYLVLIITESIVKPGLFTSAYYLVSALVAGGMVMWTTLFGAYVGNLRYKIQTRNEELERALARIRVLADRDELTGLYNRRVIMQVIERQVTRAKRTGETFSICIMDLDHFKNVNDRYGHATGDRVLKEFSDFILGELRAMDIAAVSGRSETAFARYGGEEFILVMPDTDLNGAFAAAERLRMRQELLHADQPDSPFVTVSAGVAEYVPDEGVESLLRRADQALYDAKFEGRNRVCRAPP